MKEQVPDVSIIVRTHQRPAFLAKALTSLIHQDYKNFEVVIVEDGPAGSKALLTEFHELNIDYIFTDSSVGRSMAANIGLSRAKGRYINFLDDDDLLLPHHITSMVSILDNDSDIDAVHAASLEKKIAIITHEPLTISTIGEKVKYNQPLDHQRIFFENMFPIQAVMFRRKLFEEYGGIDDSLELLEDWDLWIRYSMYANFKYIDSVTSIYHVPGDKITLSKRHQQLKRYEINVKNKYIGYIKEKKYKSVNKARKLIEKINYKIRCKIGGRKLNE